MYIYNYVTYILVKSALDTGIVHFIDITHNIEMHTTNNEKITYMYACLH